MFYFSFIKCSLVTYLTFGVNALKSRRDNRLTLTFSEGQTEFLRVV